MVNKDVYIYYSLIHWHLLLATQNGFAVNRSRQSIFTIHDDIMRRKHIWGDSTCRNRRTLNDVLEVVLLKLKPARFVVADKFEVCGTYNRK